MNTEEAKAILHTYRPGTDDEGDPMFAKALSMLEEDEALAQWFDNEHSFDRMMMAKLDELEPPAGLKEKILAAQFTQQDTETANTEDDPDSGEKIVAWWQNPMMLSMAASLVILLTIVTFAFKPNTLQAETQLPRFYEAVSNHVQAKPTLEARSEDLNELKSYLASKNAPTPGNVSIPLKSIGCYAYEWEGRPVAVVCMGQKPGVHHLYIVQRSDFPDEKHPTETAFKQKGDYAMAAWADVENIYVLVAKCEKEQLQQML